MLRGTVARSMWRAALVWEHRLSVPTADLGEVERDARARKVAATSLLNCQVERLAGHRSSTVFCLASGQRYEAFVLEHTSFEVSPRSKTSHRLPLSFAT